MAACIAEAALPIVLTFLAYQTLHCKTSTEPQRFPSYRERHSAAVRRLIRITAAWRARRSCLSVCVCVCEANELSRLIAGCISKTTHAPTQPAVASAGRHQASSAGRRALCMGTADAAPPSSRFHRRTTQDAPRRIQLISGLMPAIFSLRRDVAPPGRLCGHAATAAAAAAAR